MKQLIRILAIQTIFSLLLCAANDSRNIIIQELGRIKGTAPSETLQKKYNAATAALEGTISSSRLETMKDVAQKLNDVAAYKTRPATVRLDLFLYETKLVIQCSGQSNTLPQSAKDLLDSLEDMAELTHNLAEKSGSESAERLSDTATLHIAWLLSRNNKKEKNNTTLACQPKHHTKKAIAKKAIDEAKYWKERNLSPMLKLWIIASTTYLIAGADTENDKTRQEMIATLRSIEERVATEATKEDELSPDQQAARRQAIEKLAGILAEDEKFFSISDKQKLLNDINTRVQAITSPTFDKTVSVINEEAEAAEDEVETSKEEAEVRTTEIVELYTAVQKKIDELAPNDQLKEEARKIKEAIVADLCGLAQEVECPEGITPTDIAKGGSLEERLALLKRVEESVQPLQKKIEPSEIETQLEQIKTGEVQTSGLQEKSKEEIIEKKDDAEETTTPELPIATKIKQQYEKVKAQLDKVAADTAIAPGSKDNEIKKAARATKQLIVADLCSIAQKSDCPGVAPSEIAKDKTENERLALLEIIGNQMTLRKQEFAATTRDKALEKIKIMVATTVNPEPDKKANDEAPPTAFDEEKKTTKDELYNSINSNLDEIAPQLNITDEQRAVKQDAKSTLDTIALSSNPESNLMRINTQVTAIAQSDGNVTNKLSDATAVIERIANETIPSTDSQIKKLYKDLKTELDKLAPDTEIADNANDSEQVTTQKEAARQTKTEIIADLCNIAREAQCPEDVTPSLIAQEKSMEERLDLLKTISSQLEAQLAELKKLSPGDALQKLKEETQQAVAATTEIGSGLVFRRRRWHIGGHRRRSLESVARA